MIKQFNANKARLKRHQRLRNRVEGSQVRPRLSVFRSGSQIYAQVIDHTTGKTLAAASSLDATLRDFKPEPKTVASSTEAVKEIEVVAVAAEAAPGKKAPKIWAPPQPGGKTAVCQTLLSFSKKGERKTPVEATVANPCNPTMTPAH